MSTPCSQSLRPNRLVVSEYEVPNVLVSQKWGVYSETPGRSVPRRAMKLFMQVEDNHSSHLKKIKSGEFWRERQFRFENIQNFERL